MTEIKQGTDLFKLAGLTALVTGATSGIGQRQATSLAQAGAQVIALGRRPERLQQTVQPLIDRGFEATALCADLTDREALPDITKEATDIYGKIDILCNTAGVNLRQHADDVTLQTWDQTLNLNLAVPFFLAQHLVPEMKKRGWGRIINVASLQSERAFTNGLAYGASKGGITQLTRAMAEAWSADGITCNAMAPGFFPTELTAAVFDDETHTNRLAASTAIGRNGNLEDLDGLTIFLASKASNYITGQTIYIDGGFTAK